MSWPMAGAGPQRHSRGNQSAYTGVMADTHVQPFASYIDYGTQLVADATAGLIYVSTQDGLAACSHSNLAVQWFFATSMPAGHSPTADETNGLVYFPCTDKKIYCLNTSGVKQWEFSAISQTPTGSGWRTNPIVHNGYLYAGNDDGHFYCLNATSGAFVWKTVDTGAAIRFSPAMNVAGTMMFFANQNGTAYGVNMNDGSVAWSVSLPSAVFDVYWPVVFGSYVIFCGGYNRRESIPPGPASHMIDDQTGKGGEIYPDGLSADDNKNAYLTGTVAGSWNAGAPTLDVSKKNTAFTGTVVSVPEHLENKPYRRTVFVLDQSNGSEFTYNYTRADLSPGTSYAPFTWQGTHAGCRFPGVVAYDGVYYNLSTHKQSTSSIARCTVVGWELAAPTIFRNTFHEFASDEPVVLSTTSNCLYVRLSCDRQLSTYQLDMAGNPQKWDTWRYQAPYDPDSIEDRVPNYNPGYVNGDYSILERKHLAYHGSSAVAGEYVNGVYSIHGAQSAPIFSNGAVFVHAGNSIIRYAPGGGYTGTPNTLEPRPTPVESPAIVTAGALQSELESQVSAMVAAGPLRPVYQSSGYIENILNPDYDRMFDMMSGPFETIISLLQARPHLSTGLQASLDSYIQNNYGPGQAYDFTVYCHVGWQGAAREVCPLMPEITSALAGFGKPTAAPTSNQEKIWTFNPMVFYAALKYAEQYGGTSAIVTALEGNATIMNQLNPSYIDYPPDNGTIYANAEFDPGFSTHPWVLNAYLAGYYGYIQLKILNSQTASTTITDEYTRLLALRVSQWNKDTPWVINLTPNKEGYYNQRALNGSAQWLWLVPEIAAHIRTNLLTQANDCIQHYEEIMPYWFSPKHGNSFGEGMVAPLYDTRGLFAAKAWVQQATYDDLSVYIQSPGCNVGDLYYISNIANTLDVAATVAQIGTVSISTTTPNLWEEVVISIDNIVTDATDLLFPYDASPPANVRQTNGITVNLIVERPSSAVEKKPFCYIRTTLDGSLNPISDNQWYCYLSPDESGVWTYHVEVTDVNGTVTTSTAQFTVSATPAAGENGFVVQNPSDSRYWQFQDGTAFPALGFNIEYTDLDFYNVWGSPVTGGNNLLTAIDDATFFRMWLTQWGVWGSQEPKWEHAIRVSPNPVGNDPALYFEGQSETAYNDGTYTTTTTFTLASYNSHGCAARFDDYSSCLMFARGEFLKSLEASSTYRIFLRYAIPVALAGPADAVNPYGLSLKKYLTFPDGYVGGGGPNHITYGTGDRLIGPFNASTGLSGTDVQWVEATDTYTTGGAAETLSNLVFVLENVDILDGHLQGTPHPTNFVYIDEVRIEKDLGGGNYGPNILGQSSFDLAENINDVAAARFDLFMDQVKSSGKYIKLMINDRLDMIFQNLIPSTGAYDSSFANKTSARWYGDSGADWTTQNNRTRWLQFAWWRYFYARWGHLTHIHSIELDNEGSGVTVDDIHFHLANLFAKKMQEDDDSVSWVHPRITTTSFATHRAFPTTNLLTDVTKTFFKAPMAYLSTHDYIYGINATPDESAQYQDEVFAFTDLADALPSVSSPVVRGEYQFSANHSNGETPDTALMNLDTDGTWLRNYLWAMVFHPEPIWSHMWYWRTVAKNGTVDHLHYFTAISNFIAGIPFDNGNYVDASATKSMSAGDFVVIGQKDATNGKAHLFVRADGATAATWFNKANAATITSCTGNITILGLPDGTYTVEQIDVNDGVTVLDTAQVDTAAGLTINTVDFPVLSGLQDATVFRVTFLEGVTPLNRHTSLMDYGLAIDGVLPVRDTFDVGDRLQLMGLINMASYSLVVNDIAISESIGAVNLTQHQIISVANIAVQEALDAVVLTQHQVLSVGDMAIQEALDAVVLTQHLGILVDDVAISESIDALVLVQHQLLSVADVAVAEAIDNIDLAVQGVLAVSNVAVAEAIDNVNLVQHHVLSVNSLSTAESIDSIVLYAIPNPPTLLTVIVRKR